MRSAAGEVSLSIARLANQFADLSRAQFRDCGAQCRSKWTKISEAIGLRAKNDHRKGPLFKALLFWQALIDSDQHVEAPIHHLEQWTIVKIGPPHLRSGSYLVPRQLARQAPRHASVQEHTHVNRYFETLCGYRLVQEGGFRNL